ncbi:MAG: metallophosphoesterase family protein [Thermomicrobiales bacterium]
MGERSRYSGLVSRQRLFDPPLTIGVIADTHIYPASTRRLPPEVLDLFHRANVGLIVHLGDANTRSVLEELAESAPLIAVSGNNDDPELQDMLPATITISVGRFRFGLIHGHGGRSARDQAIRKFSGKVDCVLFGHSHKPLIEQIGSTVLFNPGSATDRRWFDHFGVGLITVEEKKFTPDLVLYSDPAHLANVHVESNR